jgi:hypothetical protein
VRCTTSYDNEVALRHINVKRRKADWIGRSLRGKYLTKHGTDGKIEERKEMTGR